MKLLRNILLLLTVLMTSSCGELFGLTENDADPPEGVVLSHHDIDVMVGDSVFFEAKIYPDTAVVSYRWDLIGDSQTGKLVGNWFHALGLGEMYLEVIAENIDVVDDAVYSVRDICKINVFNWTEIPDRNEFLYETIVYASLAIDDVDLTDSIDDLQVVAVVKNEIRARAEMQEAYGVPYLVFRIVSYWPGEKATIQCYDRTKCQRWEFQEITLDGRTYGRLSDLVQLVGYSKD